MHACTSEATDRLTCLGGLHHSKPGRLVIKSVLPGRLRYLAATSMPDETGLKRAGKMWARQTQAQVSDMRGTHPSRALCRRLVLAWIGQPHLREVPRGAVDHAIRDLRRLLRSQLLPVPRLIKSYLPGYLAE